MSNGLGIPWKGLWSVYWTWVGDLQAEDLQKEDRQ